MTRARRDVGPEGAPSALEVTAQSRQAEREVEGRVAPSRSRTISAEIAEPRLPGFGLAPFRVAGLGPREVGRRIRARFENDAALTHAAAMSFFMVFALFPAFLFVVALFGLLPLADTLDRLLSYARQILPPDAASLVDKTLTQLRRGASTPILSVGAGAALWTASSGMVAVINALNIVYRVGEPRPWWKRRLVAILLTLGLTTFMVTALVLVVFGGWLGGAIASVLGLGSLFTMAWPALHWLTIVCCVTLAVGLVYRYAPARPLGWRWVAPGSVFAVLAWLTISLGLRVYVTHFANYNATYGSIGGMILLMLWLFLSNVALLVGAEINSVIEEAMRERTAGVPRAQPSGGTGTLVTGVTQAR